MFLRNQCGNVQFLCILDTWHKKRHVYWECRCWNCSLNIHLQQILANMYQVGSLHMNLLMMQMNRSRVNIRYMYCLIFLINLRMTPQDTRHRHWILLQSTCWQDTVSIHWQIQSRNKFQLSIRNMNWQIQSKNMFQVGSSSMNYPKYSMNL